MARHFPSVELLDGPDVDDATRVAAMRDLARANAYFGGTRSVLDELWCAVGSSPQRVVSVLDVGTGAGDILEQGRREARERGVRLLTMGVDFNPAMTHAAATDMPTALGDARELPFPERSFDVVLCSQLLHHFRDEDAVTVVRELTRVARERVIVSDLRRSRMTAGGFWMAATALRFHPVSRHDGFVSILRGFKPGELRELVRRAVGRTPVVRQRFGVRLTASWETTR